MKVRRQDTWRGHGIHLGNAVRYRFLETEVVWYFGRGACKHGWERTRLTALSGRSPRLRRLKTAGAL